MSLPIRQTARGEWVAVLELDADECTNVAYALGLNDGGAQELLDAADRLYAKAEEN